jgi:aspartate aminotransferase-like enzyme
VRTIRITNTSASNVVVTLYADYDGTGTAAVDALVNSITVPKNSSVIVEGGPFNFASGGRISGVAATTNVINIHLSMATI